MTFEEYVKQKADTLYLFRDNYYKELDNGNDILAKLYKDSIDELEKDLRRMSHEGVCVLDYVNEELKNRKSNLDNVVNIYTVDADNQII